MVRGHNKWFHTQHDQKNSRKSVQRERAEKGAERGNIFELFINCTTKRFIRIGYTSATLEYWLLYTA